MNLVKLTDLSITRGLGVVLGAQCLHCFIKYVCTNWLRHPNNSRNNTNAVPQNNENHNKR